MVRSCFQGFKNVTFNRSIEADNAIRAMNAAWRKSDEAYAGMMLTQELSNQFQGQLRTFDYHGASKLRIDTFSLEISEKGIECIVLPKPHDLLKGGNVVYFPAFRGGVFRDSFFRKERFAN